MAIGDERIPRSWLPSAPHAPGEAPINSVLPTLPAGWAAGAYQPGEGLARCSGATSGSLHHLLPRGPCGTLVDPGGPVPTCGRAQGCAICVQFHFSPGADLSFFFPPIKASKQLLRSPSAQPPAEYLKAGVVSWVWRVTFGEAEGPCVRPVLFVVQILCAFLFDSHHFTK